METHTEQLNVQTESIGELKLIGLPVNVAFEGEKSAIGRTKALFHQRRHEIKHQINEDRYVCPWFSNDVMFTYLYCMEVSSLEFIPDGMIGITLPASPYASVYYDGPKPFNPDPYGALYDYLQQNGLTHRNGGMNLEIYWFDRECTDDRVILQICEPVEQAES